MVEKKVKSIYGGVLDTRIQSHRFQKDEVRLVKFLSTEQYNDILATGQFEAADYENATNTDIPVPVAQNTVKSFNIEIQPKEINASKSDLASSPAAIITNEDILKHNNEDDSEEFPTCECGVLMIKDEDAKNWKCVACGKIKPIVVLPPVAPTETESKQRVVSKCPMCGKRKRSSEDLCDKCKQTNIVL